MRKQAPGGLPAISIIQADQSPLYHMWHNSSTLQFTTLSMLHCFWDQHI